MSPLVAVLLGYAYSSLLGMNKVQFSTKDYASSSSCAVRL